MATAKNLYTLTEVSKRTGISMPTLQRYKEKYQRRIPSVGTGRSQRYPKKALEVFSAIKEENLKKRGRKRPAAKRGKKGAAGKAKAAPGGDLLTLLEIRRRTGISYPTLLRYVKLYSDKIPHVGSGRSRRYPPKAVAEFRKIRAASRRGPRSSGSGPRSARVTSAALTRRIKKLEKAQRDLNKQLDDLKRLLRKPMKITIRPS